jgi:DUF1009 family protein
MSERSDWQSQSRTGADSTIGIVCGGGTLPFAVADAVLRRGGQVVLFAIKGSAETTGVARYPHHWIALGQYGRLRRLAQKEGCHELVLIGSLVRPAISKVQFDWQALRLLPRIVRLFRGGDNHLLSGIGKILEEDGFRLRGAHEIAPELLASAGVIGKYAPLERDRADIARGLALVQALGPFDVGQAVVVADQHVLAIEAAEGTDGMLERVAELRGKGRIATPPGVGVLVKAPKPDQDARIDLPSIGPRTVEAIARAGLSGVAVAAGRTLIAEADRVITAADAARVFIVGIEVEGLR